MLSGLQSVLVDRRKAFSYQNRYCELKLYLSVIMKIYMMNVCLCRSLIVGVSFCFSSAVYCQSWFDSVSVGAGTSFDHEFLAHIGIQHNFDKQWWESDSGSLSAYLDLSLNNWSLPGKDDLRIVAISPVFTYQFSTRLFGAKPNLECGIGGSYISEYVFNDRDMGGKFQFEDRIAFGLHYDFGTLMLTYLHYSNGGIYSQNAGMNSVLLKFRYFW